MSKELGMFVATDLYMHHVLGIAKAARNKGLNVRVFLSWKGSKLTKDSSFGDLVDLARVEVCADSYSRMGYDPEKDIPPGLTSKQMATQSKHVEMINECDYYLTL